MYILFNFTLYLTPKYYTSIDKDGYAEYNAERSTYKGEFVWEYNYGAYLEPIYSELKNIGINLEHDIYGEYNEMIERVMRKVKK